MRTFVFSLVALLLASTSAHAMRCGNRVVSAGAQDFQVRERCGEPFWTDRYTNVDVIGAYGLLEQQRSVEFQVWYYNFGSSQLMRQLVFREGVLLREETLGYGVNQIGGDCNLDRALDGLSVGELVARCGEPASRRNQTDTIVRRPVRGVELWRDERRGQWIYDDADSGFVRIVRVAGGRVEGVDRVQR